MLGDRLYVGSAVGEFVLTASVYGGSAVKGDSTSAWNFVVVGRSVHWASEAGVRVLRPSGEVATLLPPLPGARPLGIAFDGSDLQWLEFTKPDVTLRWASPSGIVGGALSVGSGGNDLAATPTETFLMQSPSLGDNELVSIRRSDGKTTALGRFNSSLLSGVPVSGSERWVYGSAVARRWRIDLVTGLLSERALDGHGSALALDAQRVYFGRTSSGPAAILAWKHSEWDSAPDKLGYLPPPSGLVAGIATDRSCIYYVWSHGEGHGQLYKMPKPP